MNKRLIFFLFCQLLILKVFAHTSVEIQEYFIESEKGTEIIAIDEGVVSEINFNADKGLFLTILYERFGVEVTYCNLSATCVRKGRKVQKNDIIARSGMSGYILEPGITLKVKLLKEIFLFGGRKEQNISE